MTLEERYLLALIRTGINADVQADDVFAATPAWSSVYRLSAQQGVLAAAWDGLQSIRRSGKRMNCRERDTRAIRCDD